MEVNFALFFFKVLYTYGGNFRAVKVLVAAEYSGVKVDLDPKFVFGETNKSEGFRKKFPLGKVGVVLIKKCWCWFGSADVILLVGDDRSQPSRLRMEKLTLVKVMRLLISSQMRP